MSLIITIGAKEFYPSTSLFTAVGLDQMQFARDVAGYVGGITPREVKRLLDLHDLKNDTVGEFLDFVKEN